MKDIDAVSNFVNGQSVEGYKFKMRIFDPTTHVIDETHPSSLLWEFVDISSISINDNKEVLNFNFKPSIYFAWPSALTVEDKFAKKTIKPEPLKNVNWTSDAELEYMGKETWPITDTNNTIIPANSGFFEYTMEYCPATSSVITEDETTGEEIVEEVECKDPNGNLIYDFAKVKLNTASLEENATPAKIYLYNDYAYFKYLEQNGIKTNASYTISLKFQRGHAN